MRRAIQSVLGAVVGAVVGAAPGVALIAAGPGEPAAAALALAALGALAGFALARPGVAVGRAVRGSLPALPSAPGVVRPGRAGGGDPGGASPPPIGPPPDALDRRWLTPTVVGIAEGIWADQAFDRLPGLADALEEAGCDHPRVLRDCRENADAADAAGGGRVAGLILAAAHGPALFTDRWERAVSLLRLAFDDVRGGFRLNLGGYEYSSTPGRVETLADGLVRAAFTGEGRLATVSSFWGDHGGLPLWAIHRTDAVRPLGLPPVQNGAPDPEGSFRVAPPETRVGPVLVRQGPDALEVWFGPGDQFPAGGWECVTDAGGAVSVYLTPEEADAGFPVPNRERLAAVPHVGGFRFRWGRVAAAYPLALLKLSCEDFK